MIWIFLSACCFDNATVDDLFGFIIVICLNYNWAHTHSTSNTKCHGRTVFTLHLSLDNVPHPSKTSSSSRASHHHSITINPPTDAPLWVYSQKRKEEYGWNTIWCQQWNGIIVGCVAFITNTIHNNTTCNIRSR